MDFQLPELGEGIYEAELVQWMVKPGQAVRHGDSLAEVLTDKANMDVPSPFSGTIVSLAAQPGQNLQVGDVILSYETGSEAQSPSDEGTLESQQPTPSSGVATPALPDAQANAISSAPAAPRPNGPLSDVKAAPSVRRMARSLGIDLASVPGSGRDGRVLIGDLAAHAQARPSQPVETSQTGQAIQSLDRGVAGSRVPLVGMRRKIAQHMVLAKRSIPHYSYMDECDISELVRVRAALKTRQARQGVKLTYLAFFVKAAVAALTDVPLVNARYDEQQDEIALYDHYHVGIATATSRGLIVPVVHHADQLSVVQLAQEIQRLTEAARAGQSQIDDLRDGTFTVSSIGNIGGLISTPIINYPEVGIMGVGKSVRRPVYDEHDRIRPADILYLSFSFDHRVVDGAIGALFGNVVKQNLEAPANLLLE